MSDCVIQYRSLISHGRHAQSRAAARIFPVWAGLSIMGQFAPVYKCFAQNALLLTADTDGRTAMNTERRQPTPTRLLISRRRRCCCMCLYVLKRPRSIYVMMPSWSADDALTRRVCVFSVLPRCRSEMICILWYEWVCMCVCRRINKTM